MHLTEADRTVLAALVETAGPDDGAASDRIARAVDGDVGDVGERLDGLVEAGLARESAGTYAPTASARRALHAPGDGAADDAIDTPIAVEAALAGMDVRADRADAVRKAFAVVRTTGAATPDDIVDAVHAENPAGYDDPGEWWAVVRDGLEAVAERSALTRDGRVWRYPSDDEADGRRVLDS